jgi:hypothetical protein
MASHRRLFEAKRNAIILHFFKFSCYYEVLTMKEIDDWMKGCSSGPVIVLFGLNYKYHKTYHKIIKHVNYIGLKN